MKLKNPETGYFIGYEILPGKKKPAITYGREGITVSCGSFKDQQHADDFYQMLLTIFNVNLEET